MNSIKTTHHAGGYADFAFAQEVYDYLPAIKLRNDISFYVELAQNSGNSVLELAAGTGRIAIPMAKACVNVTALDISGYMLSVLRESIEHEPPSIREHLRIVEADMRNFDLRETFDSVIIPFYSFQHLTETEDQVACLESCCQHMNEGGRLAINLTNPSLPRIMSDKSFEETQAEPEFDLPNGKKVIRKIRDTAKDLENQVITSEFIYYVTHPDGKEQRLVQELKMRYAFKNEIEHLLTRCGFEIEALYEDFEKTPYGTNHSIKEIGWSAGEMIVIAKKV